MVDAENMGATCRGWEGFHVLLQINSHNKGDKHILSLALVPVCNVQTNTTFAEPIGGTESNILTFSYLIKVWARKNHVIKTFRI